MAEPVDTGEVNSFSLLGNTSPQCFPGMAGGGNSALAEKDGWIKWYYNVHLLQHTV